MGFPLPIPTRIQVVVSEDESLGVMLRYKSKEAFQDASWFSGMVTKKLPGMSEKKYFQDVFQEGEKEEHVNSFMVVGMDTNKKEGSLKWPELTTEDAFVETIHR